LDKIRFPIESSGRRFLLVILVSLLLLTTALSEVAPAQSNTADSKDVVRQVAQKWIQIGAEQYKRGYFRAAEQSFLRAQDYNEYLTADEREQLTALLNKTHAGVVERERILEAIRAADELVKQGELDEAKSHLANIKDSEFLTNEERELITKGLEKLDAQLKAQSEAVRPEDNLEATIADVARELLGGVEAESDRAAQQRAFEELNELALAAVPGQEIPGQEVSEPSAAEEDSYIEVINRKRSIRQSHTEAVVNDAVAKVQNYTSQDEFDKAKEEVAKAERIVNEYQMDLGDELFKKHTDELKQLAEKIDQEQEKRARQLQEQKRLEAIEGTDGD
jgi:hypothetical protein